MLFPNEDVAIILARMIGMLGPIDLEMLVRGQETQKYFTKEYDIYHVNEVRPPFELFFIYDYPLLESVFQHLHF